MYTLETSQVVNTTMGNAWDFISSPRNLDKITPENLSFSIISNVPDEMYNGLIIEYKIKIPLIGKQTWISEIKHIRPGVSFVDEQRQGPYKFWYHYHEIRKVENGVLLIDRINYELPFPPIGRAVHLLFVKNTLNKIFEFRKKKFDELLNGKSSSM
ncbi:MAG: SRPBCC family protein [Calditrichae bacterium]|nr:SRPBCC family protein [Calditrichota bacterium]MCB9058450.1 SRPBCC family protein [Calditrichia bacterium]